MSGHDGTVVERERSFPQFPQAFPQLSEEKSAKRHERRLRTMGFAPLFPQGCGKHCGEKPRKIVGEGT